MRRDSPFLCSVHTHATLCDGKDPVEEMAAAAYAAGVRYYGVSCHSHTPIQQDEGCVLPQDLTAYRSRVLRLREQYDGKMEVLLGLEWDSCSDVAPEGFDYWIGSVHYLHPENGEYYAVDLDREQLEICRKNAFGGEMGALVRAYFQQVAEVAAKRPPILGHLDLITKLNRGNCLFDESAPEYQAAALEALRMVDPAATVVEINTGAMARGYRTVPYPALFLLKEWRALGGRIIVTSDAHTADGILYGYDQAIALAKEAGFTESVLLTRNGFVECPL